MLKLPFDSCLKIVFIHRSRPVSLQAPDEMMMFDSEEHEDHQSNR